jgi:hypothetical protein
MRQILLNGSNGKSKTLNVEGYIQDGSLVIVDSLASYFNQGYNNNNNNNHHLHYEIDKEEDNNNNNNNNNKLNFLSLIRILLNHGIKNNKTGITIFSDMGSFFHFNSASYKNNNDNNNNNNIDDNIDNDTLNKILEYERSIPSSYKDLELKKFCLYHQKDYELHFKSTCQKAQLLDCHGRSILIMDGNNNNNNNNYGHNTKNKNN